MHKLPSGPLPPGLLISAPASGGGKTTVALGLMRALRDNGLTVQPFKCGPDYIDPAFHRAACGRPSFNLDPWSMGPALFAGLAAQAVGTDMVIAEGAMGLFDGAAEPGAQGTGAAAEVAQALGWPVILVVDVAKQAQTAAAVARGLADFRPGVTVAGVILNRVAGARHERLVRQAMTAAGLPVLGALPRREDLTLPERHLGLVQAAETPELDAILDRLAAFIRAHVDVAAACAVAGQTRDGRAAPGGFPPPPGQRIAVAHDAAFSFLYPHLLTGWRAAGAELLFFSPLADEAPDDTADVAWLPGGYPELHAGRLAAATGFRDGLFRFAATRPVHGECGGYMALGQGLIDKDGVRHAMVGLLGLETSFACRRLHLGYRRVTLLAPMPGFAAGAVLRGHEFHYATVIKQPDPPLAKVFDAEGCEVAETGARRGRVTGSFFHMIAEDKSDD